jgi:hypothetical protein
VLGITPPDYPVNDNPTLVVETTLEMDLSQILKMVA